jgi:acyl-CoA synthetase (AMP-forming)/AMP-acid ligase II
MRADRIDREAAMMTQSRFLEPSGIVSAVLDACERFGDLVAFRDDGVDVSFTELRNLVLDAVRGFIGQGVEPGDRIGLCAPNSGRWMVAALGIQGAGGVLVPLNTRFKGEELAYILSCSGARGIVLDDASRRLSMIRAADGPELDKGLVVDLDGDDWERFLAGGTPVSETEALERVANVGPGDLSDILFTSGTTGHPKGVPFTHAQSVRAYGDLGDGFGFRAGDRFLLIPPFFHALGYKSGWFAALLHGVTVLPERRFDSRRMLDRIEEDRVTMMIGPPTIFEELLGQPGRRDRDLSSLRLVVPSATNVPPELVRRMRSELGIEHVLTGYGLTEASAIVSYSRAGDEPDRVADSVGRPAPGVAVHVVDEDGQPVGPGCRGDILVGGYTVMSGYWEDPAATDVALTPEGLLRTGDIGELDEHGFLRITGRKKDMLLVGGFNVYPAEVERILAQHPSVGEVAVVGMPDQRLGEVGCAFVVPAAGTTVVASEVQDWARNRMANYKIPRLIEVVSDLPRNPSMKVLRGELRERIARLGDAGGSR